MLSTITFRRRINSIKNWWEVGKRWQKEVKDCETFVKYWWNLYKSWLKLVECNIAWCKEEKIDKSW